MLKSKSILAEKSPDDGTRISIMSRHTLNDGKTPDDRLLVPGLFDAHMPEFAATGKMVGSYYRKELTFDEYGEQYSELLDTKHKDKVIALIEKAAKETITVMCIEDTPEYCHRRLFVEYSKKLADTLGIPLEIEIN